MLKRRRRAGENPDRTLGPAEPVQTVAPRRAHLDLAPRRSRCKTPLRSKPNRSARGGFVAAREGEGAV